MRKSKNEAGISLLEAIVGMAITGILALVLASMLTHAFKATKSARVRSDIPTLRNTVNSRVSCGATYSSMTSCIPGTITLRDKFGTAISKLGDWTINPTVVCAATGDYINVSATNSSIDPVTGQAFDQMKTSATTTVSTDLFGGTRPLCSGYWNGGATSSCALPAGAASGTNVFSTHYDTSGNPACDTATISVVMGKDPDPIARDCSNAPWTGYSSCWGYNMSAACPTNWVITGVTMRCDLPYSDPGPPDTCDKKIFGMTDYSYGLGSLTWQGRCLEFFNGATCTPQNFYPTNLTLPNSSYAAVITCTKVVQ